MKIGNQNVTRKQHTVQQEYLSNWLNNDLILFAMDVECKRIYPSSTNGICSRRDFYKVSKLNADEKRFILKLIPEKLNDVRDFIISLINTINSKYYVEINNKSVEKNLNDYIEKHIDEIMEPANILVGEELTHPIEEGLTVEMRESLKTLKDDFMTDVQKRVDFYTYLFFQIYRTSKSKIRLMMFLDSIESNNISIDADRIYPLFVITLSLVQATIISAHNKHNITFLVNGSDKKEFFTSDNPVINICDSFDSEGAPIDYKLYWPISPSISIILSRDVKDKIVNVSLEEVDYYNGLLCKECEKIIISQKKNHLEDFVNKK